MTQGEKWERHLEWLRRVSEGPEATISRETAVRSMMALKAIQEKAWFLIPAPHDEWTNGVDGITLAWRSESDYMEIEINPDYPIEFFYRKTRVLDQFWGADWMLDEPIPDKVIPCLSFFMEDA